MATVRFIPLGLSSETTEDETVLDAARRAGAPLGNACGGVGVCARCRVVVIEGAGNLGDPTRIERIVAEERELKPSERLACQAVVRGPCTVTTTYWGPVPQLSRSSPKDVANDAPPELRGRTDAGSSGND